MGDVAVAGIIGRVAAGALPWPEIVSWPARCCWRPWGSSPCSIVPNARVRRRDAIVGGLLAGIAFELGKRGFAFYLQNVPTYRTVYGAFAPLLAFLLWVYFSWLVTLAAALVTANLARAGKQPARRLSRA